jgi:single-strand DNA-binding protein
VHEGNAENEAVENEAGAAARLPCKVSCRGAGVTTGGDSGASLAFSQMMAKEAMAGSVNKVILVGNLGRDPEVRNLQDGSKVVHLSVATSERWKDRQSGENRERTEWHRVVIFNDRLGEVAERFLRKGSKVYLEGALQTRKWTGQDGQDRYTTEVVLQRFRGELTLLDGRAGEGYTGGPGPDSYEPDSGRASQRSPGPGADLDDEIPF